MGKVWEIRSNTASHALAYFLTGAAGAALVLLTRHAAAGDRGALAGYWLGVMLLALVAAGLILDEETTVVVDGDSRQLRVERQTRFGGGTAVIPFSEVAGVEAARQAGSGRAGETFCLVISRKDGRKQRTGRWSFDRGEIMALAEELAADIGCPCESESPVYGSTQGWHVLAAAAGAVLSYALWFRLSVGALCPAMWFGTAPPVIMLLAFVGILGLVRRLPGGRG